MFLRWMLLSCINDIDQNLKYQQHAALCNYDKKTEVIQFTSRFVKRKHPLCYDNYYQTFQQIARPWSYFVQRT